MDDLKVLDEVITDIFSSGWEKNIYMENMDDAFFGNIIDVIDQIKINFTKTKIYKDIECLLSEEDLNDCENKTIIVMRYDIHDYKSVFIICIMYIFYICRKNIINYISV